MEGSKLNRKSHMAGNEGTTHNVEAFIITCNFNVVLETGKRSFRSSNVTNRAVAVNRVLFLFTHQK